MSRPDDTYIRNPFPGLRPFREDEEHLFFGRESQVHSMIDKLSATRFLGVVGTSGSGKSSLVNCGLRPALRRGLMAKAGTSWRMAQFRPAGNPIGALAQALAEDGVLFSGFDSGTLRLEDILEASLRMSKLGLSKVFSDAHLPEGTNLLVIVDQFEELFRYRNIDRSQLSDLQQRSIEATAFVNLLLAHRTQINLPIYVVLTMRSDFLGDCAEFTGLPEALNEGEYLIPRLTREERRAAIAGPIGVGGADITPVLLTRLVNDVGDNPDQLSILQHALNRTWFYWESEDKPLGPLDFDHYEAIGTMAHALDRHAEKAFGELPAGRSRELCEKVFKALTDKGTDPRGIRRPTKFEVLCRLADASADEVSEVLRVFRKPSRSFIMPPLPEELGRDTVIDISHESLMRIWARLIQWTDEEVQSAHLYRRLAETAELHAQGKAGLWNDPDLQSALDWKEKEQPTEVWAELYGGGFGRAIEFLADSEAHRDKEQREQEEVRQRELQHAQDLAAERQRRLEDQARAAARLRKRMYAFAVVTVCALFAAVCAGVLGVRARNAQSLADSERDQVKKALNTVEAERSGAKAAQTRAEAATKEAQMRLQQAVMADNEMRLEALRVRDANLTSQSDLVNLADTLLQSSHPQQSSQWQRMKGQALLSLGTYDEAQESLSKALAASPDDLAARTSRGYLSFIRNRPKEALQDFEYIRDHIDRAYPLNNLNLALTYAAMANYARARSSLRDALSGMRHRDTEGGGEDIVPPDITKATGRATLEAYGAVFVTALYYMQASIEAAVGNTAAFERALYRADESAKSLLPVARKDAYFVAMTWAWLQLGSNCSELGVTCKDYGAIASQAALWERAGYKDWAACYYERFEQMNKNRPDKRYTPLAIWVGQAKKGIGPTAAACSTNGQVAPDVPTLEVEAREAQARQNFEKAKDLLGQAIQQAGPAEKNRLLFVKADVLLANGRAERQLAENQDNNAAAAKDQLDSLEKSKGAEEDSLRKLASKEGPNPSTIRKIEERYASKIAAARAEEATAEQSRELHDHKAQAAFQELKHDCTEILRKDPLSATAFYYRALADDWLDPDGRTAVLADLRQSLHIDPANLAALSLVEELVPEGKPEEKQYLEDNRPFLERYFKSMPYTQAAFLYQAELAEQGKRYGEALRMVETAIDMDPTKLRPYRVRADIQKALGFDESQIAINLADGYRQAVYVSRMRGQNSSVADSAAWKELAEVAKKKRSDKVECDTLLTTCTVTKVVEAHGESIYSAIVEITGNAENAEVVQARINRGSEDGVVVGTNGNVWSSISKDSAGHRRDIAKLGYSEVLAVEPHSALIRIQVEKPAGDGIVRKQDMVQLMARTPKLAARSPLWQLAKTDTTLRDADDKVVVDYETLYANETPELDSKLYARMLDEIHREALLQSNTEILRTGAFANHSLRQAMQNTQRANVELFIDYLANYPGSTFGEQFYIGPLYARWISYMGEQSEEGTSSSTTQTPVPHERSGESQSNTSLTPH